MTPLYWIAMVQILLGGIVIGVGIADDDGPTCAVGIALIGLAGAFVVAA